MKNRLLGLGGPKLRFHADIVAPVLARNRDDIRWMEQRLEAPELDWLAEQLGAPLIGPATPERVAIWMHALRLKMARKARAPAWKRALGKIRGMLRI